MLSSERRRDDETATYLARDEFDHSGCCHTYQCCRDRNEEDGEQDERNDGDRLSTRWGIQIERGAVLQFGMTVINSERTEK